MRTFEFIVSGVWIEDCKRCCDMTECNGSVNRLRIMGPVPAPHSAAWF